MGLQCGGSDGFWGVRGKGGVGYGGDLLVWGGGRVSF
ncbi:UxaA family hydrolase, partial [Bacillus subtilis]